MRLALRPTRKPTAHASSRTLLRSRSIRTACASASSRRRGWCAPTTSCSPATSISAGSCRKSPARCCRFRPMWSYGAAGDALARGDRISRHRERHRTCRQSLSCCRRRPADVVGRGQHVGARPAPLYVKQLQADIARTYPQLGEVRGRICLDRHARQLAASHAADRRAEAERLACQRLRRPWPQHHGDGRRSSSRAGWWRTTTRGGAFSRSS